MKALGRDPEKVSQSYNFHFNNIFSIRSLDFVSYFGIICCIYPKGTTISFLFPMSRRISLKEKLFILHFFDFFFSEACKSLLQDN